jgi:hypothetical protein
VILPFFNGFLNGLCHHGTRNSGLAAVAARCLWDELDLQSRIWTSPNLRTKNARPHIVHLSDQAIAAVYQRHQFMSKRKEALEKWGAHVAQILSLALAEERWGLGRVA